MKAFHGDKAVKKKYCDRVLAHQKADRIVQGTGWENGKGCAVGCTLENYNHSRYPIELGIPEWLARIEDRIFEGLDKKEALKWPLTFLKSINTGSNLEKIKIPMLVFIVQEAKKNFDHKKYPQQLIAINDVLKELKRGKIDEKKLKDAAYAAYAAAYAANAAAYAAYAADAADAAYAANAAAYAAADAAYAANAAAYAAADAADAAYAAAYAAYAARKDQYKKFAKHLLKLLKGCK